MFHKKHCMLIKSLEMIMEQGRAECQENDRDKMFELFRKERRLVTHEYG
jgi:hypothetical protein